jgi:putative membrane-bound dehydrogenase-like protein
MRRLNCCYVAALLLTAAVNPAPAADGNRLAYLDGPLDPYYPHTDFPKLITPQWVGEEGVECVVTLAIDDMRDPAKYEAFLRPILDRLKKIDGRAPVSIMTCKVDPMDPQLQAWLKEGLSIECHTIDHPCPLLKDGDFAKAKETYEKCVDLMNQIPGSKPVAFRMPCCDSLNTPSPRFWAEIFNKTTPEGNFLQIDSSVFNVISGKDESLPKEIRFLPDGSERFRRYIPFKNFVNTIEDYPYPYVIGRMCWEFPCVVPSDWSAQHVQMPNNPDTVRDWKLALDACVLKQGVFNLVFHPHGWIRAEQIVELIDHAVEKHGKKVKFLTFRECAERLNKSLTAIRKASEPSDTASLFDQNNDGFMDVSFFGAFAKQSLHGLLWNAESRTWEKQVVNGRNGRVLLLNFSDTKSLMNARDIDGDGVMENLIDEPCDDGSKRLSVVRMKDSSQLLFKGPVGVRKESQNGRDDGLRLIDVNADGKLDCLFSNAERYSLHLFKDMKEGWSIKAIEGVRGQDGGIGPVIPPFVRADGTNNGAWFHSGALWVQNEDTAKLPDLVQKLTFAEMLAPLDNTNPKRERGTDTNPKRQRGSETALVGASKIDITPDHPIRLTGYGGRKTESEGVEQKIWAKALAVSEFSELPRKAIGEPAKRPHDLAILITVDNLGIGWDTTKEVAERLAKKVSLKPERLAICASHTHTGPMLKNVATNIFGVDLPPDQQKHVDDYSALLVEKLEQVALDAIKNQKPGRLFHGQGKVTFAANRRTKGGPVDHALPILKAVDSEGKLIAVLSNYACHCTTLGPETNKIHGDWAGCAQEFIEAENPGVIAMTAIGCGADANPQPRTGLDFAKQNGRALADEVNRLLKTELTPIAAELRCRQETIELPFDDPPSRDELVKRIQQTNQLGHQARNYLKLLDDGGKLPDHINYPVTSWSFGDDLGMVFLPGEVVVDYAIRLKAEYSDNLWVTAYANDAPCYIPSRRIRREGGYEGGGAMVYYNQPTSLKEEVEDLIVNAVRRLVPYRFLNPEIKLEFPPPKSPAEALAAFTLRPGMQIELVAAEPLIVDPVAFDWGPDGRLWVVEMHDYPTGIDGNWKPGGRVEVLEDTDGDGNYDKSTRFLDGLEFPTGIKVWRKGCLVTAAPEIFYAEDTDGDGKVDKREVLYKGFGEGNQQHRVNGLRWGLDGWLYVGNGDSGGIIKSLKTGEEVNVNGRDLRVRPEIGGIDAQTGNTQFGRERNDWGDWFGGNNSNPIFHYTLEDDYLRRNPHAAPPELRHQISVAPGASPVYPKSRTLARFNDFAMANKFTSACSQIIYRDNFLGKEFEGNYFVCEPVHNLVHREPVVSDGCTFKAQRAGDEQESEFLASSDNWFRPSMCRVGPDGALWIADMYRFVIEHPKWIPPEIQAKLDLRAGDDKGRIYRVYPTNAGPRQFVRLDKLDAAGLVAALETPNGWQRDKAHELLLERNDKKAIGPLTKLLANSKLPQARLHALYAVDQLGGLSDGALIAALKDEHGGIRRHAIRLAETRLKKTPALAGKLLSLASDADPMVRLQLAYTLGETQEANASSALARLAVANYADPYITAAVMSSLTKENIGPVLASVLSGDGDQRVPESIVQRLLALATAFGDDTVVNKALASILQPADGTLGSRQFAALAGILDVLERQKKSLDKLLDGSSRPRAKALYVEARKLAADDAAEVTVRASAIRLLGRGIDGQSEDIDRLGSLLTPQTPAELQSAAVAALGRLPVADVPKKLLAGWLSHTPALRGQILDALLARSNWTSELLDAIEKQEVPGNQIDARHRQQLVTYRTETLRTRAEKLLAGAVDANRQKVLDEYKSALSATGDATAGKAVFAKRCANCHRLENVGHYVGPDLTALADRSSSVILIAVLDPNRAVEDRYLDYLAQTTDGRQVTGMLLAETGNSITLAGPEGKQTILLRSEIEQLKSSGKSLMPDGVEKDISLPEMTDLLAYVRSIGAPPKKFAGNKPEVVRAFNDGSIRLFAENARIYGPTAIFEEKWRNVGWWQSPEDHVIWSLEVPTAGEYNVVIDYACDNDAAGDSYVIDVAGQRISGKAEATGTWENYRSKTLGTVKLPVGPTELVVRPDGPIRSALMDLRGVRLAPAKN